MTHIGVSPGGVTWNVYRHVGESDADYVARCGICRERLATFWAKHKAKAFRAVSALWFRQKAKAEFAAEPLTYAEAERAYKMARSEYYKARYKANHVWKAGHAHPTFIAAESKLKRTKARFDALKKAGAK